MNPSDEKGQVKLTARGSQAKRTKFHSKLFRRHPFSYQMLTAHLSLHTSMNTPIQKMSSTSKHKTLQRKKFHNFSDSFANCRCSAVVAVVVSAYCSLVNRGDTCALTTPPHLSRLYLGIMDTLGHGHRLTSHHACWSSLC